MNVCTCKKLWIAICIVVSMILGGCNLIKESANSQIDPGEISSQEDTETLAEAEPEVEDMEEAPEEPTPFAADAAPSPNMGMSKGEAAAKSTGLLGQANAMNSMMNSDDLDWSGFDASANSGSAGYGLGATGAGAGGAGMGGFGAGGFGPGGGGGGSLGSKGGGGRVLGFQYGSDITTLNENEFKSFQPNQFNNVLNSPFSTFGADVDTASYSILRYYIQKEHSLPTNQLLRTEEMLNYFKYDYPNPKEGEPFSITTELVNTPWNEGTKLLLIGMQTPKLQREKIPNSNIVFLVDVSGSMYYDDKLPLLKKTIIASLDSFTENDTISIVTYASENKLVISGANPVRDRKKIQAAVDAMTADGFTYGERGLEMAYEEAAKYFIKGGNNRIILGTDGDLNVGISSENELKAFVEKKRDQGVFLSVLGFGWGNLKDNRMETLADNGNGSYHYIDSIEEAKRVLVEDRDSTLFTVAKDVKFQIDFNPSKVKGYRLIGYETRKLNTEDFKDDKKDGGEIGANQQMTALYEIVPAGSDIEVAHTQSAYQKTDLIPSDDLATLAVRYKKPDENTSQEIKISIASTVSPKMSENIQFAAAVTEVGMLLNNSEFKGTSTYESALQLLKPLNSVESDPLRAEFLTMVQKMPQLVSYAENQAKQAEEELKEMKERVEKYGSGESVVRMKMPNVSGALDRRLVMKVVRQHFGELRACHDKTFSKKKAVYGMLTVSWEVNPQGVVDKVKIIDSAIKDKDMQKCITTAIKYWRFPAPKDGAPVTVEYPFEFGIRY